MPNKHYQAGYQKVFEDNKLVAAVASTPDPDRDGEIVDPMGMDMTQFRKNPILLWAHDHFRLPIGKILDIRVTAQGIEFDAEFAENNSFAQEVKDLFRQGILNAFSIGFIPLERRNEKITRAELLEISAVNIPANPMALNNRSYKSFTKSLLEKQLQYKIEEQEKDEAVKVEQDVIPEKLRDEKELENVEKPPAELIPVIDEKMLDEKLKKHFQNISNHIDHLISKQPKPQNKPNKHKAQLTILKKVTK